VLHAGPVQLLGLHHQRGAQTDAGAHARSLQHEEPLLPLLCDYSPRPLSIRRAASTRAASSSGPLHCTSASVPHLMQAAMRFMMLLAFTVLPFATRFTSLSNFIMALANMPAGRICM